MELGDIRKEIDAIDGEIAQLFVRRMKAAASVAAAKRESGKPVLDPARERAVLAKAAAAVGPDFESEGRLLFSTLMALSRGHQRRLLSTGGAFVRMLEKAVADTPPRFPTQATVACPGAEGGYSQQAASALVQTPSILYFKDFNAVFSAVEQGMCEYGVLPVENSAAGSVTQVYDLMAKHDFKIVKAKKLRIRHVLLAQRGVRLGDVREIASHPHALAQCSEFLQAHPDVKAVPASNTAAAADALAKSGRRDAAVIASRDCAALYGLDVLAEDISDAASNYTRFILISRKCEIYPDASKVSLTMSLAHRPGALADVLMRFAAAGVNLAKLESRPVPGSDFEFRFVFDLEASPRDPAVADLLAGLAGDPSVERFVFLGGYAEH